MAHKLGPNAQKRYFASPSNASSQQNLVDQKTPQAAFVKPPTVPIASPFGPGAVRQTSSISRAPSSTASASVSEKYNLSPDPYAWGTDLTRPEEDDAFHNPEATRDRRVDHGGHLFTGRGLINVGCLAILGVGLVALFAGYPVITYITKSPMSTNGGFNLGGVNASGIVPEMPYRRGPIDPDTPKEFYTKKAIRDGSEMQLVFSDEFNVDGRTFYPGEDPYWEAVDLHYWVTNNMEWYDPAQIFTKDGALHVVLDEKNPADNHDLGWAGGMMTTWNKFCFTGGLVEASVMLPGASNVMGLWPAIWTMGNLGRAGYGASTDGMWPYTYDECDVGTLKNQTLNNLPVAATQGGDPDAVPPGILSYLPGQRLSRCTCPGETHPGPVHSDGTYVGRSAPEIDIFEATVTGDLIGEVSQSGQWAPFDDGYDWKVDDTTVKIFNETVAKINTYKGARYQEATSALAITNPQCYELSNDPCYAVYGFEYKPGFEDAYIAWINDGQPSWMMEASAVGANPRVEISARPVPQEPMYIIINLGMSRNFGFVDLDHLKFPATMKVDYIRVYQKYGREGPKINCDPDDFPTASYIERFIDAYTNPDLTTWVDDFKQQFPKNRLIDQC